MATVKSLHISEQNANTLNGLQYDTAVYGTGASAPVVRVGRDVASGGVYIVAGVQTSVNAVVILDTVNAFNGATVVVKRLPLAVSTSVITVLSGSAAGGTAGVLGTSSSGEVTAVYDGVNDVWR